MREKLIELLETVPPLDAVIMGLRNGKQLISTSRVADHLIANGVTIVTDNNVGNKLTPTGKDTNVPSNVPDTDFGKWIPVSERLPFAEYGESDDVLTITESGVIRTLCFDGGNWCFQNGDCCLYKVTHWMPLPELPKEE